MYYCMRYYLDFDRTIFDTPAFKKMLSNQPTITELWQQFQDMLEELADPASTGSKRSAFIDAIGTLLSTGRLFFVPNELAKFLHPEVPEFLKKYGPETTIVTYGVQAFIVAKVSSALTDMSIKEIVYTKHRKGRTIRRLTANQQGPFVFVDDAIFQLRSVSKYCPDVQVIEIRRDGRSGDGRWPVIHTLEELREHIKSN
jgi:cystathionine beta-lyase/cystathionine gamma-synthase